MFKRYSCETYSKANPQYLVRLEAPDSGASDCVLIMACMQKYTRQKRMQVGGESAEEFIQVNSQEYIN